MQIIQSLGVPYKLCVNVWVQTRKIEPRMLILPHPLDLGRPSLYEPSAKLIRAENALVKKLLATEVSVAVFSSCSFLSRTL